MAMQTRLLALTDDVVLTLNAVSSLISFLKAEGVGPEDTVVVTQASSLSNFLLLCSRRNFSLDYDKFNLGKRYPVCRLS